MKPLLLCLSLAVALLAPGCSDNAQPAQRNYVAAKSSKVFHRTTCRFVAKIHPQNMVWYSTAAEASADGHRPCKVCKP